MEIFVSSDRHRIWFQKFSNPFNYILYLANERILIDFKKDGKHVGFFPDSLTIDTDGFLYVTTWGGSKIFKIDPK